MNSNYNEVKPAFPALPEQDHFNQKPVVITPQVDPVDNIGEDQLQPGEAPADNVSGGIR